MESAAPSLVELERIQTNILERISALDRSLPESPSVAAPSDGDTVSRLSDILRRSGSRSFRFARVPGDYYDRPFEERRRILGADTVDHLCKSIVMLYDAIGANFKFQVNTQAPPNIIDCSDQSNSKYYIVVVQYTARLNAEALKAYLYSLNDGKIPKKKFNLRLAPEETSFALTGFEHNAVTCVGMKTDIPVILDEAIVKLRPDFFWLGGGEVDLKLGIRTSEFVDFARPFIVSCSS